MLNMVNAKESNIIPTLVTGVHAPRKRVHEKTYFSYFSTKTYVVGIQKSRLIETVLLSTQNICITKTYVVGNQKNRLNETGLLSTQIICKTDG